MTPRRHYPRFDTSSCPDPKDCARRYHGIGGPDTGDVCECCGVEVTSDWLTEIVDHHLQQLANEIRDTARQREADPLDVNLALITLGLDPVIVEIHAQDPGWLP